MPITATRIGDLEFAENEPRFVFERWKLTGTGAGIVGDTATCTLHGVGKASHVEGCGALVSQSGAVATIKALVALGSDSTVIRIYGKAGSGMS